MDFCRGDITPYTLQGREKRNCNDGRFGDGLSGSASNPFMSDKAFDLCNIAA
jgi:hypothetical protein